MSKIDFTIIIPSYNEGEDIRLSIESALSQNLPPTEILVVDDSTDKTPEIIKEYESRGVQLVAGEHKGCCGARNLGMRAAKGDVVVLLNGDVKLPPDFLQKINVHYESGADYVLVESRVLNQEDVFAAFVEAQHLLNYSGREDIEWTEGFSARLSAVREVGYIPGEFNVRFCRDWMLGRRLCDAGFKKVIDLSIIVTHKAPAEFREYWKVRSARGRFGAFTQHYIYGRSKNYLAARFFAKHLLRTVSLITLLYPLLLSWRIAKFSPRPVRNLLPFFYAYLLQEIARMSGEWQGVVRMG